MKEKYQIEIESKGEYEERKEFNTVVELTPRQFLKLTQIVIDTIDSLRNEDEI